MDTAPSGPPAGPVELERWVTVITPESTVLRFALAGPGSRFAAALLDTLIQAGLLLVLLTVALVPLVWRQGHPAWTAHSVRYLWPLLLGAAALLVWGYHVLFELAWNGQTPGKRALCLRVVREGGYAVGLTAAVLRNILRAVDVLPGVAPYLLGGAVMGLHPRFQRVGDQVAGTLVVRERPTPWLARLLRGEAVPAASPICFHAAELAQVTAAEMAAVTRFLERRDSLPWPARRELVASLAGPLRKRLESRRGGPIAEDEDWLEALQSAWVARRRRW